MVQKHHFKKKKGVICETSMFTLIYKFVKCYFAACSFSPSMQDLTRSSCTDARCKQETSGPICKKHGYPQASTIQ